MGAHRDKNSERGKKRSHYRKQKKEQGKCCAICGRYEDLVKDHCHITGQYRGLLCCGCNTGLGFMQDKPHILLKAFYYLKSWRRKFAVNHGKHSTRQQREFEMLTYSDYNIVEYDDNIKYKRTGKGHTYNRNLSLRKRG